MDAYLYILMESDLHTSCKSYAMFKFTDVTNLLLPENSDVSMKDEIAHTKWVLQNKIIIN